MRRPNRQLTLFYLMCRYQHLGLLFGLLDACFYVGDLAIIYTWFSFWFDSFYCIFPVTDKNYWSITRLFNWAVWIANFQYMLNDIRFILVGIILLGCCGGGSSSSLRFGVWIVAQNCNVERLANLNARLLAQVDFFGTWKLSSNLFTLSVLISDNRISLFGVFLAVFFAICNSVWCLPLLDAGFDDIFKANRDWLWLACVDWKTRVWSLLLWVLVMVLRKLISALVYTWIVFVNCAYVHFWYSTLLNERNWRIAADWWSLDWVWSENIAFVLLCRCAIGITWSARRYWINGRFFNDFESLNRRAGLLLISDQRWHFSVMLYPLDRYFCLFGHWMILLLLLVGRTGISGLTGVTLLWNFDVSFGIPSVFGAVRVCTVVCHHLDRLLAFYLVKLVAWIINRKNLRVVILYFLYDLRTRRFFGHDR